MSKILGNARKAYIRVTQGTTLEWLGGEQSNSVSRTAEAIEVSDKSTEWAEFISGKKGATIEITVYADDTDTAQMAAINALMEGTEVYWGVGTISNGMLTSGDSGTAIVTAVSDTNDFGAVASRTISMTATGEVLHS